MHEFKEFPKMLYRGDGNEHVIVHDEDEEKKARGDGFADFAPVSAAEAPAEEPVPTETEEPAETAQTHQAATTATAPARRGRKARAK